MNCCCCVAKVITWPFDLCFDVRARLERNQQSRAHAQRQAQTDAPSQKITIANL